MPARRDLSSPTKVEPVPLLVKAQSPSHWTTREFPKKMIKNKQTEMHRTAPHPKNETVCHSVVSDSL